MFSNGGKRVTLGGDKNYDTLEFVRELRGMIYCSRLQPLPIAKSNGPSMTSDGDTGQLIESHAI